MKSRRLTILCVALVALVGTPRALHEAGRVLAAIQHKAQVKFWSMVLQPKTLENADTQLVATARTIDADSAFDSTCPLKHAAESPERQASERPKAARRITASLEPKAQASGRSNSLTAPSSHAALMAETRKALREIKDIEVLRDFKGLSESELSDLSARVPAPVAAPAVSVHALPHSPTAAGKKGDAFKYVMVPTAIPAEAAAFVSKESLVQFKLVRKALEDSRLIRQKNRLPAMSRGAAAFPST